jgi:cytochrome b6-f complex iron-sulfur subunit
MPQRRSFNRREFFSWISLAWISFGAALSGIFSMFFRYFYPNMNFEPEMEFNIGRPDQYEDGISELFKNSHGVWIVKKDGVLFALSTICTHLGCIPNWTDSSSTFECPCHGSGYYDSGVNFKGPAPRPLERYEIKQNSDGTLLVNKSKIFRQEKGQWGLPGSELVLS